MVGLACQVLTEFHAGQNFAVAEKEQGMENAGAWGQGVGVVGEIAPLVLDAFWKSDLIDLKYCLMEFPYHKPVASIVTCSIE